MVDNKSPLPSRMASTEDGGFVTVPEEGVKRKDTPTSSKPVVLSGSVTDSDARKAQPLFDSFKRTLTAAVAAAVSSTHEAKDESAVGKKSSVVLSMKHKPYATNSSLCSTALLKPTPSGTSISSPTKGTQSTPTKGTTSNPTKGTTLNSAKGTTSNPAKGTTSNHAKGTTSNPAKGTNSNSIKGTTSSPSKSTTSNPAKGSTSNPTKGSTLNTAKGTTLNSAKGTASSPSKGSAPAKTTSTSTKDHDMASSRPPSPFLCSCGRTFDTKRGLSIHLAHGPGHNHVSNNPSDSAVSTSSASKIVSTSPSVSKDDTSTLQDKEPEENSSPPPSTISTTTPNSPTLFNMASFKTSARNPQYYSIIRTRRASNITDGGVSGDSSFLPELPASKRPRTNISGSSSEPLANSFSSKGTHRSNDEDKILIGQEDNVSNTPSHSSSIDLGNKKQSREIGEPKKQSGKYKSRSSVDGEGSNTSPSIPSVKKEDSTEDMDYSNDLASSLHELALRNSPVTRSNAATLKTHEFISLPTRRTRGKKVGGGWRGGWRGSGKGSSKPDASSDDGSEEVGEDFESPTDVRSTLNDSGQSSSRKSRGRNISTASGSTTVSVAPTTIAKSSSNKSLEQSSDESPLQPPKRRRGRPPKVRNTTPNSVPIKNGGSNIEVGKVSASSSSSGQTRSGKYHSRGGKGSIASAKPAPNDVELDTEEGPLASKSKLPTTVAAPASTCASKRSTLPNWDSFGKSGEEGVNSEPGNDNSPSVISNILPRRFRGRNKDTTLLTSGNADTPPVSSGGSHSMKRALPEEEKDDPVPKKRQKRRKISVANNKATNPKKEQEKIEIVAVADKETSAGSGSEDELLVEEELKGGKQDGSKSPEKKLTTACPRPPAPGPSKRESRSKAKTWKSTSKSKSPAKSMKEKLRKKSHSETEEMDIDVSVECESKSEEKKDREVDRKGPEDASPAPTAQISVTQQRQSSVFVSVLSGPTDKSQQHTAELSPTGEKSNSSNSSTSGYNGNCEPSSSKDEGGKGAEKDSRPSEPPHPQAAPIFPYQSSSPTTPTYPQFPYPASFPPPPHHMMYHPSGHPSAAMYPPPFYAYPGSQPMQMPPHGTFLPPHPMNVAHPVAQSTSGVEQNPTSPHTLQSQQLQQQVSFNSQGAQTPSVVTSAATTVGGVMVSVLEKPITQLPMVNMPYHMPNATPSRGPHPPPGVGGYPAMELHPGMRGYMAGAGGQQTPDGIDTRQHIHPHPLNQVYRPNMAGMISTYHHPPAHLQPSYPPLALRMDQMSFIDWGHVSEYIMMTAFTVQQNKKFCLHDRDRLLLEGRHSTSHPG